MYRFKIFSLLGLVLQQMANVVFAALPALNLFFSGAQIPCSQGWQPPGWVFAAAWTLLAGTTGATGALLLQTTDKIAVASFALLCFLLGPGWSTSTQACNSYVTFFAVYATLICAIFLFLRLRTLGGSSKNARAESNLASWLLLPLICWLSFAQLLSSNSARLALKS